MNVERAGSRDWLLSGGGGGDFTDYSSQVFVAWMGTNKKQVGGAESAFARRRKPNVSNVNALLTIPSSTQRKCEVRVCLWLESSVCVCCFVFCFVLFCFF